jgi:chromosome segregation ATPase
LSENNSDLFKPDTEEKVAELQEKLAAADLLLAKKNQEIAELNARLAAANQKVSKCDAEIERLQSELEEARGPRHPLYTKIKELEERNRLLTIKSREERQKLEEELKNLRYSFESAGRRLAEKQARLDELEELAEQQNPAPIAIGELPEAADLLNQLKTRRKKSSATLADVEKILEIIEESQ